jgi:RecA-family ATPase
MSSERTDEPPDDGTPAFNYDDESEAQGTRGNGTANAADQRAAPRNVALNWAELQGKEPPAREWIVPHWIPAAHVTLLAGRAGIGKTLLAQHIGTALAHGVRYIESLTARRVLMWAGEDDTAELWRRQIHISSYLAHPLSALTDRFFLHSYGGADLTLAAPVFGRLETTPLLGQLREQVHDYRAELVILDNLARIFGGSENDRHQVTTFIAWVQGACAPAALLLLGHPAKSASSEFSGSSAWEGAVRARLYLSDRPPDAKIDEDAPVEERFRFLSRRKAEFARDTVRRAVERLAQRELYGALGAKSDRYLPKLAKQFSLLDTLTEKAFAAAMRQLVLTGELTPKTVGQYANRTPILGLVLTPRTS